MANVSIFAENSTDDASNSARVSATLLGSKRALDVASSSIPYATIVDDASATVTYVGKATIGTATSAGTWQIFKITLSGNLTIITWADADSNFDNIWDDRASLTYS